MISNKRIQPVFLSAGIVFLIFNPFAKPLLQWLGYDLHQWCVQSAGGLLGVFYRVHVEGIRMLLCGKDILPDQPVFSAQIALLALLFFGMLTRMGRPKIGPAMVGLWNTLFWIYVANTVRLFSLATGKAFPNLVAHVDVAAPFWHDGIGWLSFFFLGLIPILLSCRNWLSPSKYIVTAVVESPTDREEPTPSLRQSNCRTFTSRLRLWFACLSVACALVFITSPASSQDSGTAKTSHTFSGRWNTLRASQFSSAPDERFAFSQFGAKAIRLLVGSHLIFSPQISPIHAPFINSFIKPMSQRQGIQHVCHAKKLPKKRYC